MPQESTVDLAERPGRAPIHLPRDQVGAHNRAEAVRIAQEKGWLEPGS